MRGRVPDKNEVMPDAPPGVTRSKRGRPRGSDAGPLDAVLIWVAVESRRTAWTSVRRAATFAAQGLKKYAGDNLDAESLRRIYRQVERWRARYPEVRSVTDKYLDALSTENPGKRLIPLRFKTAKGWRTSVQRRVWRASRGHNLNNGSNK
jgi:hypothetical protein